MFIASKWVFRQREEWQKVQESVMIRALEHCQACHYCSLWNENQKRGRSPMVTFTKFASDCFDISNSWRFEHAFFEDSPYVKNVKIMEALCRGENILKFYHTRWNMKTADRLYNNCTDQRYFSSCSCILFTKRPPCKYSPLQTREFYMNLYVSQALFYIKRQSKTRICRAKWSPRTGIHV